MNATSADQSVSRSTEPALPPHVQVIQMAGGHIVAKAIYALAELAIADQLSEGPRTADDLAGATNTHAPSLYRLLRFAASLGFFVEDETRRFALTPLGAALRSDAPGCARSTVRMLGGPFMWPAVGEMLHSLETGEPAFEKAQGQPVFDFLGQRPEQARIFNEAMIGFHGAEPPAVAAGYDFSGIRTLVDVGGGTGNLLTTILEVYPTLHGVLFDLPHVAAEARQRIAVKGLADRCEVKEGSFFESIPAGADAYMMSHIIHDWDEAKCLTILGHCRRALGDGGRLLLVEMVIPPGNDFHPSKLLDVIMMTVPGGKERTADEYHQLFARAGFELTRVVPTASPVSVVEGRPV
jgi:hypothetical protein